MFKKLGIYTKTDVEKAYHKGFYEGTLAVGGKYKDKLPKTISLIKVNKEHYKRAKKSFK